MRKLDRDELYRFWKLIGKFELSDSHYDIIEKLILEDTLVLGSVITIPVIFLKKI